MKPKLLPGPKARIMHYYRGYRLVVPPANPVTERWKIKPGGKRQNELSIALNSADISSLNKALKGNSYPIIEAAVGAAAGVASTGAGLALSAISAVKSHTESKSKHNEIRIRTGDQLICREWIKGRQEAMRHIFWIIVFDPYRKDQIGTIHWEEMEIEP